jgi:1-acyl-sn-glycerol-3-phosphate acyltransferase
MIYRVFRALARLSLQLFFRRIEIEARYNLPHGGPVLLVPNHSNSLVDPLLLLTSTRRRLTLTAKDTLRSNPLLRFLIWGLGVVTFHRKQDVGDGSGRRKNVESLDRCRQILAEGGAICIFPEGVSHSDPKLREFQIGPAKLAIDFVRKTGNPGRLRIVPVGMLYTDKDKFRSSAWLRFGEPIDVASWMGAHPDGDAGKLTEEICRQVSALTLNYETQKESALVRWAGEIMATGGREPSPLGAAELPLADWFRLLGRLQSGYSALKRAQPVVVDELSAAVRRYRSELRRAGITAAEVHLRMHPGRAAFFVIRELELLLVGAPLAVFGLINHWLPCSVVRAIARRLSKDKDHWATNVIYPSLIVFPLFYALQLAAAWRWLPALWATLYTVALPYTGYYAILYSERGRSAFRRTKTFLRFLFHHDEQQRLVAEGRSIVDRIQKLAAELPAEPVEAPELRGSAVSPTFLPSASDQAGDDGQRNPYPSRTTRAE